METKLSNMLKVITLELSEKEVAFCLIGAMALGLYGLPRYTSDIDFLAQEDTWPIILSVMEKLGYSCFQKTNSFAQFDSELGVYGKVDFMLVTTRDGKDIISDSTIVNDPFFMNIPVIQPTDYIILKLMAVANNSDRHLKDTADISLFLELYNKKQVANEFKQLDISKIKRFADRFGQRELITKYLDFSEKDDKNNYRL